MKANFEKEKLATLLCFFSLSFLLFGCHETVEIKNDLSIEGVINDSTVMKNSVVKMEIQVNSKNGLSSFYIENEEFEVENLTQFKKTYLVHANLENWKGKIQDGAIIINFIATDKFGNVLAKTSRLKVDNSSLEVNVIEIESDITDDQIWYTGNIYLLKKRITLHAPHKLIIQKGVVVKGETREDELTALVISRGAKIDAQGTPDMPIIFTSSIDNIKPGEIEPSYNLIFDHNFYDEKRDPDFSKEKGTWGGLILLGKARCSLPGNVVENTLPSISKIGSLAKYGGSDDSDNSGVLKNISIRWAGSRKFSGQNIASLTLAGVGSGTKIENIDILMGGEDGIDIFGGNVTLKNILTNSIADDAIEIDQGWSGQLNNYIILSSGDNGFEINGPKGSFYFGNHEIVNGLISCWPCKGFVSFSDNSNSNLSKSIFNLQSWVTNTYQFDFGINKLPVIYNSQIDQLEVFHHHGPIPSLWKERFFPGLLDHQIKSVTYRANSVGPYLSQFRTWSWLINRIESNYSYIMGL